MRRQSVMLLAVALACFGFGCAKKPVAQPAETTSTAQAPTQQQFPTFAPKPVVLTTKDELQQVLQNYAATKSFRAKVHTKSGSTDVIGAMEFMKPNRFRGIIQSSAQVQTELIIVDNDLYMRNNDGAWSDLSSSKGSKTLGEAMRTALSGDSSLQQIVLNDSSTVDKSEDPARGCTLYTVHLNDNTGQRDVGICAAGGLPKFVDTTKNDGTSTSIEYYDYNTVFTIARPL